MQPKTWKIIYWILLTLFSLFMLYSGISQFIHLQQGIDFMTHLGYAPHVSTIIGIAKILGVIALVQPWLRTIKEWAFAGFAIDLIGATASFAFVDGIMAAVFMLPFLVFFFVLYYCYRKVESRT